MTLLPRFFVLQHDGKYLTVRENLLDCLPSGFLKFDEQDIWSPRVKFAAEQSETADGTLVHIRSCYNNKYWVAHEFQGRLWIVASADKPEEDQASPACTLFRASSSTSSGKQFFEFLCIHKSLHPLYYLEGGLALDKWDCSVFHAVDWETLVILPPQVTFRYDELDGNYVCSRVINNYKVHRFESGTDIADPLVAFQLYPTLDGNYRIKNLHLGKFCKIALGDLLSADAEDDDNSNQTLYSFVKLGDNVIAFRHLGTDKFCGIFTGENIWKNTLCAYFPTMSRNARLIVEEPIMKRTISDVRYRLSHSRIYQEKIQQVSYAFAANESPDKDSTITLTFSISDSRTTSWNNSVSVNSSVKVEFNTNIIPLIEEGMIQLSTDFGYVPEWRGSKTTSFHRDVSYAVLVPPLTKKKVILMCTKAACDVPFSYTQRDLHTDGKWVTTAKDDGVYTGINSYNFYLDSSC